MPASQYWELSVSTSEETSEGLTNFVWELGALGVLEETHPCGGGRLRAFFSASAEAETLGIRLREYLEGLRILGFGVSDDAQIIPLADPGWAQAWRDHFQPLAVGGRLLIVPPWERPLSPGRSVVVIEPGRAFGTGYHGSTAGCLELLEQIVEREHPPRALDLGTGSGILAIAAARLGVSDVVAIDDDPDAVANAAANIEHNEVGDQVRCALGEASALAVPPAPLVLANLLAAAHHRLGPTYRRLVTPGGTLVLGGILAGEADDVMTAVRRHGFDGGTVLTREEWASLALTRSDP